MILSFRTRGNTTVNGKEKVLLIVAEKDRLGYSDVLIGDILEAADVAVYYLSSDESGGDHIEIRDSELTEHLTDFRMIIFAVTSSFLGDNGVCNTVLSYVMGRKPYIPVILEENLLPFYNERFGEIQFLDPYELYEKGKDEIPYKEKLKKRLNEVLVSDEDRDNIEKAFKALIFLSYRKVDRREAQQLMRLLHKDPECEDVAIWYDEFLVPGENFNDAIQAAMGRSDLFVFNVTDNLLEMWEGKPNYVMAQEYPSARISGKPIIPVEMRATDRDGLRKYYEGIDDGFVSIDDHEKVPKELLQALEKIKDSLQRKHPSDTEIGEEEKSYYIGLAYLGGVNMEQDPDRARACFERAAGSGLIKAMKRLSVAYKIGEFGKIDIDKSTEWLKSAVEVEAGMLKDNPETEALAALKEDCFSLWDMYDSVKSQEGMAYCRALIEESVYPLLDQAGEEHKDQIAEIVLESTCRSGNRRLCSEILKRYESPDGPENCIKRIQYGCNSAMRLRTVDFLRGCGNALASLERLYRDSISDEGLFELYLLMTKGYRANTYSPGIQEMPDGTFLKIDKDYYENDVPGWSYANKGLAIALEAVRTNPEDTDWIKRLADMEYELGQTIAIAVTDLPDDFIDEEINEMMTDLLGKASDTYVRIAETTADREAIKQYVEKMTGSAYKRIMMDPTGPGALKGIGEYRKAIEMAEKLYEVDKSRENLLFLWKTLTYCCGVNLGYEFPDKALKVAELLDDMDRNAASKLRLAEAYMARARLHYRREGEFEKAVESDYFLSEEELAEKTEDIEKAVNIYSEILEKEDGLPAGLLSEVYLKQNEAYLSVPDCSRGKAYAKKASELICEGLDRIEDGAAFKWDWYEDWKLLFGKLDGDKPEERKDSAFKKWVNELDKDAREFLLKGSEGITPRWLIEKSEHLSCIKNNSLYHILYVYGMHHKLKDVISGVILQLFTWYDSNQFHDEEYLFPRFIMDRFKMIEAMEDNSDEELLLRIIEDYISAGGDEYGRQGDLLLKLGRKAEAMDSYREEIRISEDRLKELEKKQKLNEALIKQGIRKPDPFMIMGIRGLEGHIRKYREKLDALK